MLKQCPYAAPAWRKRRLRPPGSRRWSRKQPASPGRSASAWGRELGGRRISCLGRTKPWAAAPARPRPAGQIGGWGLPAPRRARPDGRQGPGSPGQPWVGSTCSGHVGACAGAPHLVHLVQKHGKLGGGVVGRHVGVELLGQAAVGALRGTGGAGAAPTSGRLSTLVWQGEAASSRSTPAPPATPPPLLPTRSGVPKPPVPSSEPTPHAWSHAGQTSRAAGAPVAAARGGALHALGWGCLASTYAYLDLVRAGSGGHAQHLVVRGILLVRLAGGGLGLPGCHRQTAGASTAALHAALQPAATGGRSASRRSSQGGPVPACSAAAGEHATCAEHIRRPAASARSCRRRAAPGPLRGCCQHRRWRHEGCRVQRVCRKQLTRREAE